jgi:hypothetical protein
MAAIGKIEWFTADDVNPAITFRTERCSRGADAVLYLLAFELPALFPDLEEPSIVYVIKKEEGGEDSYSSEIHNREHAESLFTLINAGALS